MAEVLETMPKRKPRATRHPWDEWTDGKVRVIKRGEDFSGKVEPMRVRLYSVANDIDKKLEIVVDRGAEEITFQFRDKTPEDIAAEKAAAEKRAAKAAAKAAVETED